MMYISRGCTHLIVHVQTVKMSLSYAWLISIIVYISRSALVVDNGGN